MLIKCNTKLPINFLALTSSHNDNLEQAIANDALSCLLCTRFSDKPLYSVALAHAYDCSVHTFNATKKLSLL